MAAPRIILGDSMNRSLLVALVLVAALSARADPLPRGGPHPAHFWFAFTVASSAVLVGVLCLVSFIPGTVVDAETFDQQMRDAAAGPDDVSGPLPHSRRAR